MQLLSIITVNYNNESGLKDTIESVKKQNIDNIEHIIIDGASTDNSLSILEEYSSHITYKSEPDKGIYQAMNKGVKLARGEFVLFLNSGDILYSDEVISKTLLSLKPDYDLYYGDLIFKSNTHTSLRQYPEQLNFSFFLKESLPHPATFIKKSLFNRIFYYTETFKIVSDWEFFIYAVCKENVRYKYLEETISVFGLDGISNNPENKKLIASERKEVLQKHFPAFIDDYKDISLLDNNRFKILKELETSSFSKKLNSIWLRLVLFLIKRKTPKKL